MRMLGMIEGVNNAQAFSDFLSEKQIQHQVDLLTNLDWGSPEYGLKEFTFWIIEEEKYADAFHWFQFFKEHRHDPIFEMSSPHFQQQLPSTENNEEPLKNTEEPTNTPPLINQPSLGWVTKWIIGICCVIFMLTQLINTTHQGIGNGSVLKMFTSPVEKVLLYDYPEFYQLIDRFIQTYGVDGLQNKENLSLAEQELIQKINHTPYWTGLYQILLKNKLGNLENAIAVQPMFEKIKEGQVWRLISPVFLHADIFHIFFNMIWLLVLGKQIEAKLSVGRYLFLMLLIGLFSNAAQYLMSGPNFLGYSGILCGMLTFIRVRQKRASWEGYQLDRMTYLFMIVFILGMAGLEFLSFMSEKFFNMALSPNIANMAHLSGAALGLLLGRLSFFRWRHTS